MDRSIVYPGEVPADEDILFPQVAAVIGLGALVSATLGSPGPWVDGAAVGPTSPASMSVSVAPGSMYALWQVDSAAYGSMDADSRPLMKQGVALTAQTLGPFTAPTTAGQSVNVLIQGTMQETDTNPVLLPYMNANNPAVPYGGPGNNGVSQPTRRTCAFVAAAKVGTAATTGTQVTPTADTGYVPLAVVTIAFGQWSIVAGNITAHPSAPGLPAKLGNFADITTSLADASKKIALTEWVQALLATYATQAWVMSKGYLTQRIPTRVLFTAAGAWTWTVPAGITRVEINQIGGGGGGAGASAGQAGGGGGGGGRVKKIFTVSPGDTLSGTVGAGGTAGSAGVNNATAGGDTTILQNGTLIATGGGGGAGAFGTAPAGGYGGTASGGDSNWPGMDGGDASPGGNTYGGYGGAGVEGAGGPLATTTGGRTGTAPGAGGSGAYQNANAGGNGAIGQVEILY